MRQTVTAIDDRLDRRAPAARRDELAGGAAVRRDEPQRGAGARRGGRMWLNGEEVGGTHPRFAHLGASYD